MGKAMSGDALPLISAADVRKGKENVLDSTEGWIGGENDERYDMGEGLLQVDGSGCVGIDIEA